MHLFRYTVLPLCHAIYNLNSNKVSPLKWTARQFIQVHTISPVFNNNRTYWQLFRRDFPCNVKSFLGPLDKYITCFPWLHCNPLSTKVWHKEPIPTCGQPLEIGYARKRGFPFFASLLVRMLPLLPPLRLISFLKVECTILELRESQRVLKKRGNVGEVFVSKVF